MTTIGSTNPSFTDRVRSFFFDREVPVGMALLRIIMPWALLIDVVIRWPHVRELYSADGAPGPLADNFGYPGFLPELPGSVAVALFTAMIFLFITGSIGFYTRFSFAVVTLLYPYFGLMDCMGTITKYTVIATHFLLLLAVSECGVVWSVDAWLFRRRYGEAAYEARLHVPVWPARLVQLLLGFIYFGAAITKIHTPAFFSGDQLMYWMMTYAFSKQHALGDILAQYPIILSSFGYITITWETIFLFTVFQKWMKWWVLAVGAIFHIMTWFTLGLTIFPIVMISSYIVFVTEEEVRRWLALPVLRGRGSDLLPSSAAVSAACRDVAPQIRWRLHVATAGCFALALVAVSLGGVAAERQLDPYRFNGPNGPLALRELPQEEVERLFSTDQPLRHVDKVLAFDLGSIMVGEHVVDRRREFRQNERFFAHLTLSPPHEDMWVDCILTEVRKQEDADGNVELVPGKLITKVGQIVPRENFRSNFIFRLDESCEPGEYMLRLRTGNEEIARRNFTLTGNASAPAAN